jgi:hypothetical protein
MPGFVPGIHALLSERGKDVDGRDKPGHDEVERPARMAGTAFSPSPNARNPAKVRIRRRLPPSLDIPG